MTSQEHFNLNIKLAFHLIHTWGGRKMPSPIQAVYFDFDNTLVDYIRSDILALTQLANSLTNVDAMIFVDRAVEHIMAFHALVDQGKANPQDTHVYRLSNTVNDFGLSWEPRYLDIYLDSYLHNIYVFPGVPEMLGKLKVKTGLISNSYLIEEQKLRIHRSGLSNYFDDILVCGEIGWYKPAPQAFLHLINKYRLQPERCIYVGDSESHDIRGANNAGLISIRLAQGPATESQANYVCQSIPQLSQLLAELNCL